MQYRSELLFGQVLQMSHGQAQNVNSIYDVKVIFKVHQHDRFERSVLV